MDSTDEPIFKSIGSSIKNSKDQNNFNSKVSKTSGVKSNSLDVKMSDS